MRLYDCLFYGRCLDGAARINSCLNCDHCEKFAAVPEAHEAALFTEERKENQIEGKCKIEGCEAKIVAQNLCDKHYNGWRRGNEEVVKAMGGPFKSIRNTRGTKSRSAYGKRICASPIAPGSQVVKKIMSKVGASANGDLQKAVDFLIAKGFLSEELLIAARVIVKYDNERPLQS